MEKILTFVLLLGITYGLLIPLNDSVRQRCMIAHTFGAHETLKLDLYFPPIPNGQTGEIYRIVMYDTERNETKKDLIYAKGGEYKVETHLLEKTLYRLCFSIQLNRTLEKQLYIDYNADIDFNYHPKRLNTPEDILKTSDVIPISNKILEIYQLNDKFILLQKDRQNNENKLFEQNRNLASQLLNYSRIQLILVAGVAALQVFILRRFLSQAKFI